MSLKLLVQILKFRSLSTGWFPRAEWSPLCRRQFQALFPGTTKFRKHISEIGLQGHCIFSRCLLVSDWICHGGNWTCRHLFRELANDGVLLAAEWHNIHKLLDEVFFSEKISELTEDMACTVASITSDANVLTDELRGSLLKGIYYSIRS